jgi:mRNA interferase HigB
MRVIARKTLMDFWKRLGCGDAEQPLRAWLHETKTADWSSPADIKAMYRSASILGNNRVVFNIGGNKYRLVVAVNYRARIVFIRFVGSHADYDRINAEEI